MTTKKLLNNLNTNAQNWNNTRTFKVIAKAEHNEAKSVFILVEEEGRPAFILAYRLDINSLTECKEIYTGKLWAHTLKAFEDAIEK